MDRGLFVTFEGIEGSGKSSVAREVGEAFGRAGLPVLLAREPGGAPVPEAIRRVLLDPAHRGLSPRAELLLYLASRAQLVEEVVRPALGRGVSVLCDRFMDASVAYQGWARGLGEELVAELNAFAVAGVVPDRTFVLDLPVPDGFARGPERREAEGERRRDRLELEDRDFHERVREGYLRIASREPGRVTVIDAAMPLEAVVGAIVRNLRALPGLSDL
ncbi:MAG: dTMP kinase [Candidatus Krumholzibacteria bacterium]|nr:dTMP kinase [Candidatus Krumholzibacteria bacterium]